MATTVPTISSDLFKEILQDNNIIQAEDLQIFQTIYSMSRHEGTATDIANILGYADKAAIIGKIVGLGLRIVKKHGVDRRIRDNGKASNWDLFFTGYDKETFFVWQLKTELIQALEELSLVNITTKISIQNSYLFAWNPGKWNWEDLENNIEELQNRGTTTLRWSCRSHKSIKIGDRAFLVRLGSMPRGLMASGYVVSNTFSSPHWSGEGKHVQRVLIEFDVLLNPDKEPLPLLALLPKFKTSPTQSHRRWASSPKTEVSKPFARTLPLTVLQLKPKFTIPKSLQTLYNYPSLLTQLYV